MQIEIFKNTEFLVRTIKENNQIYFVANDVARALGYSDLHGTIRKKVKAEYKVFKKVAGDNCKNKQNTTFITKEGVLQLCSSKSIDGDVRIRLLKFLDIHDSTIIDVRSEIAFKRDLIDFCNVMGWSVECQYKMGPYFIDFLINGLYAVEYDENDHSNYDMQSEWIRDQMIQDKGFKLIRLSDKNSNATNVALIVKTITANTIIHRNKDGNTLPF